MQALELLPLIAFFITYKLYGMICATATIIFVTCATLCFTIFIKKQTPSKMTIFSSALIIVMGSITVFTADATFIQVKPTIFYSICALILLAGVLYKKYFIQNLLGAILSLSPTKWRHISLQWVVFLVCAAIANEIVRRAMSEDLWMTFKVIIMPVFTIFMMLAQLAIYRKYLNKR